MLIKIDEHNTYHMHNKETEGTNKPNSEAVARKTVNKEEARVTVPTLLTTTSDLFTSTRLCLYSFFLLEFLAIHFTSFFFFLPTLIIG